MTKTLLIIGYGYTAKALAKRLIPQGWRIYGTTRNKDKFDTIRAEGVEPVLWPSEVNKPLQEATHLLMTAGPGDGRDPFIAQFGSNVAQRAPNIEWAGYLSTTGVYGDHGGAWVDEETALTPSTDRGKARVQAEEDWQSTGLPLHVFRLAGIYGPGRNPLERVKSGSAKRIIKEGQVFSRVHVEDIAQVLEASMTRPRPGAVYNVCDDDPAPPQDVLEHAAKLLGLPPPPAVRFEDAEMSEMARSFYAESKRVRNDLIKSELGIELLYPTYREGLGALLKHERT